MSAPAYLAATPGQVLKAQHVNQFLGAHPTSYLYTGTQQLAQSTLGSGTVASNSLYIAQKITTTGAFNLGRVTLTLAVTGTPTPTTISIQTNSGSAPSGTALASTVLPPQMGTGSAAAVSIPLPCSLSASTTYWIVASAAGDASDFFAYSKSNQTSGASTSTNGTSWTAQTYGICFATFDQSAVLGPLPVHTYADSGARWATYTLNILGLPTAVQEYTAGQTATGYTYSSRALTAFFGVLSSIT